MTEFPIRSKLCVDLDRATYPRYFLGDTILQRCFFHLMTLSFCNLLDFTVSIKGTGTTNSTVTWLFMPTTDVGHKAYLEKKEKKKEIYKYKSYKGPSQIGVLL